MTIKKLSDFQAEIYQDAAKTSASHGMTYVDMNAHLLSMAESGDISEALIREDWVNAGISPVRQLLHAAGITPGRHQRRHVRRVLPGRRNYVPGADVVSPDPPAGNIDEGSLGINASSGWSAPDRLNTNPLDASLRRMKVHPDDPEPALGANVTYQGGQLVLGAWTDTSMLGGKQRPVPPGGRPRLPGAGGQQSRATPAAADLGPNW